jgi:hypothetical protein
MVSDITKVLNIVTTVPPHIHREGLIEVRVKAGGVIAFDVKVDGEPAPTIEWLQNGQKLATADRTKVDNEKEVSIMLLYCLNIS